MLRAKTLLSTTCSRKKRIKLLKTRRTISSTEDTIIGIDLGTTNSCVAYVQGSKPIIIDVDGKNILPSILAIDTQGKRIVGYPAQRQMVVNPSNTFYAVKRLIGRRYEDRITNLVMKAVSYSIVAGPNGDSWVADTFGKKWSPSEISAQVLMKIKSSAEAFLQKSVTRAVITVPAYFDSHQRKATEDAGTIAGLKVERIINEPTAAALAYGISQKSDKTIAVYDMGGGTFDISILELGEGVFEVKSTAGDTFLGGEDFNSIIMKHIIDQFKSKEGIDLSSDKMALQRIRESAENAKHELSSREITKISLPYIITVNGTPKHLEMSLKRPQYEDMVKHLVEKSFVPVKKALDDANMSVNDITDVILVGGMTRMPLVRESVKKFFKKDPFIGVNPDEVVALGAALQGSIIANQGVLVVSSNDQKNGLVQKKYQEIVLLDVTPLNLGVEVTDGTLSVIIAAQTAIPCSNTKEYVTEHDFQTRVSTNVYQGNRIMAKDNRLIGSFVIDGLPPMRKGIGRVKTTFTISASGLLTVTDNLVGVNSQAQVHISLAGGLSPSEVERMKREAELYKKQDEARESFAKLKEEAKELIYKFNREVEDRNLSNQDKDKIRQELSFLQKKIDQENITFAQLGKDLVKTKNIVGDIVEKWYIAEKSN